VTDTPTEREFRRTWAKLRRRKVVQWGIAYAAGAWALLQVLAFAVDTFHWPEVAKQLAMLALAIGLPIALTLAWYHGERGQQRVTRGELTILILLSLLGGGVLWFYGQRIERTPATRAIGSPAAINERPSIAVLPFKNRSDQITDAYFVDGIHDDILTQLSKVSALKVISRTSVEQFRDTHLPTKAIAEQLGVKSILEGGVQRAGDRIRINVQLIDAATDAHLWAESYDRKLSTADIFAIQSEVAVAIAGVLKATLTRADKAQADEAPTQSLEAWESYQLGSQRLAKRTSAALADAERFFQKAIELDAEFALAYAGLADTLTLQTEYAGRPKEAGLDAAELAAARALELNPNLAEAWAAAGSAAMDRPQLELAERMLRRAIELDPNYAPAHHWLSLALLSRGAPDESLAQAEQAVELDPLSAIINFNLGFTRERLNRFEDAVRAYQKTIEIDPVMPGPYSGIGGVAAYGFGRLDQAIPWYEKAADLDPGNPAAPSHLVLLQLTLGNTEEARRWLDRALEFGEQSADPNLAAALFYLDRGNEREARRYAQIAAAMEPSAIFLLRDDDLRHGDYASARARYAAAFPELLAGERPTIDASNAGVAIELALVLQRTGEPERAKRLLDRSEAYYRTTPRMGQFGYGVADVAIHALRGEKAQALAGLRRAEKAGWCGPFWRYYRDFDPAFASIRSEAEFEAVFADIERDMARQRAQLAARAHDAPLDLDLR